MLTVTFQDLGYNTALSRTQHTGDYAGYRVKSYSHSLVAPDKQGPVDLTSEISQISS